LVGKGSEEKEGRGGTEGNPRTTQRSEKEEEEKKGRLP